MVLGQEGWKAGSKVQHLMEEIAFVHLWKGSLGFCAGAGRLHAFPLRLLPARELARAWVYSRWELWVSVSG